MRIGVPPYRQWSALNDIRPYGDADDVRQVGPEWLRRWVGGTRMPAFDEIRSFQFSHDLARPARVYVVATGAEIRVVGDRD